MDALEGVWERVEARFTTDGKTESPTKKTIHFFAKNYWVIVEHAPNRPKVSDEGTDSERLNDAKTFAAIGGTYTLEGDTLTKSVEFASAPNWIGVSIPFQVSWKGDQWIQAGKFPSKALGFGKTDIESYELWKRIE